MASRLKSAESSELGAIDGFHRGAPSVIRSTSSTAPGDRPVGARYASVLAAVVAVGLLLVTTAGHVAREALFVAPDMESDQLNLATMALARHEPGVFGRDVTFGGEVDPSRYYTPWQLELVWSLWQATGSPRGAFAAQLPGLTLLSLILSGGAAYWLTGRVVPALIVAAVATAYRPLAVEVEMWGVGPFYTAIPRSWAGPFVLVVIALWVRAVERRDGRLLALAGLVAGVLVNVHPPTCIPLSGMLLVAGFADQLGWNRHDRAGWAWWLASCAGVGLGAAPFLANYAGTATMIPNDVEAHLAATRYRFERWIWPEALDQVRWWLTVRPGESMIKLVPALATVLGAVVIAADGRARVRLRLRALLLFGGALVVVSVIVPLALQVILIQLDLSPMLAVDLLRGARLIAPLGALIGGLGIAQLLDRGPWAGLAAVGLALLLLLSVYGPSAILEFPSADVWAWAYVALGLAVFLTLAGSHGPRLANRPSAQWAPQVVILVLAVALPSGLLAAHTLVGGGLSSPPAADGASIGTEELVGWGRTLGPDAVIDTSAVSYRTAMRLRLQARRGITINLIDGAVLLYGGGPRAIEWHERMLRRDAIIRAGDFDALRVLAAEMGATAIVVERSVWNGPLPDLAPVWQNRHFAAFGCCQRAGSSLSAATVDPY